MGQIIMRLPLISSSALNPRQRQLYEDMREGIEANFKGFTAIDESGRLIGPWNPWLHFPKFGAPVWELVKALSSSPKLPRSVREIAILVTGAHFHSAYEIYAHVLVAELRGLPTTGSRRLLSDNGQVISPAKKPSRTIWRRLLFQEESFRN